MLGYYLITFKSSNRAVANEAKTEKFNTRLITVPNEIKSDCGFALKVWEKNYEEVIKIMKEEDIDGIYFYG
ncbi:DUF3343 domain-containing protein [Treponema phagedenis]|uniref:DUF3343 domain-containing protein n=1 Tax=Treponema phagedenis TaxID=162 RepID=A0AAE6M9A2_TREPH|nr:DUF3343 domain-containing protein [Treponema phagedenis]NVP24767.1 DUF3343 domain-containing protein [Treponema phagedenis]QEJ95878.1 DUF3343 domain-containing protein [Treponema phagedenis]QEJ98882.1 DUF3343 domain-containing protein [Treponema phagedenis]QKS93077.1 DUF3343 domain-containing protein [Treponema phagedenis]QLC58954.1 DUF3343 domain-containing protein [Treponema phagedenis]